MTLVVAQVALGGVSIVADTQLTVEHLRPRPDVEDAALKVVNVHGLAIAFAGNKTLADQYLGVVRSSVTVSHQLACDLLLEANIESGDEVEFLVADGRRLAKVSDGTVSEQQVAYIGSQAGFNAFREERHRGAPAWAAMGSLAGSSRFPDVGGFVIEADVTDSGVYYPAMSGLHFGLQPFTTDSKDFVPVEAASAAKGHMSFQRFPVFIAGRCAGAALYLEQPSLGVVLAGVADCFPEARFYRGLRLPEFLQHVADLKHSSG